MLNFWHNSFKAHDLRGLFLYSGSQVSHRYGCFSSSLHKSFLWASDIFSLINSQSWVPTFSTSTTSAMFTSCPNRICPRSSALPQLATSKFVAWQVESEGGNTANNAFQLATQQCCVTSCAKMLPILLDLYKNNGKNLATAPDAVHYVHEAKQARGWLWSLL